MDMLNISALSQQASDIASSSATDALKHKAQSAETDEELMSACKEFESYLWEQVIGSMKKTVDVFSEEKTDASILWLPRPSLSPGVCSKSRPLSQ